MSRAEDKLAELRGHADEAGSKVRALEGQIAEKIRSYKDE